MLIRCSKCKKLETEKFFSRNKAHKTGFANWCKDCMRGLYTADANLQRRRNYRSSNIQHALYIEAKSRARSRGMDFDLLESDLIIPEFCPVLGIRLLHETGGRTDATPTVDRIDQTKGYLRGNVAVTCWLANRLKSDCTDPAIFERIAAYMRAQAKLRLKLVG